MLIICCVYCTDVDKDCSLLARQSSVPSPVSPQPLDMTETRGYLIDLLEGIRREIRKESDRKFEFSLEFPADGKYGSVGADGAWTGAVGMLINDDADIVLANLGDLKFFLTFVRLYSLVSPHLHFRVHRTACSLCSPSLYDAFIPFFLSENRRVKHVKRATTGHGSLWSPGTIEQC